MIRGMGVVLLVSLVAFTGCAQGPAPDARPFVQAMEHLRCSTDQVAPGHYVLRTQGALRSRWPDLCRTESPHVDMDLLDVVIDIYGRAATDAPFTRIESVRTDGERATVEVIHGAPSKTCGGSDIVAYPTDAMAVHNLPPDVTFHITESAECRSVVTES